MEPTGEWSVDLADLTEGDTAHLSRPTEDARGYCLHSLLGLRKRRARPTEWDREKHGPCGDLPVRYLDGVCISCWSFSLRERLAVLFGGRVYVGVCSGKTQPPINLRVE